VCKCVMYCCHRVATKCVLYCCHRVAAHLQFNKYIISYHIFTPKIANVFFCSPINATRHARSPNFMWPP
jgi:hypothetical protein